MDIDFKTKTMHRDTLVLKPQVEFFYILGGLKVNP